MLCKKCGKDNKSNAKFCAVCGAELSDSGEGKRRSETLIVVAILVVMVLVVCSVGILIYKKSKSDGFSSNGGGLRVEKTTEEPEELPRDEIDEEIDEEISEAEWEEPDKKPVYENTEVVATYYVVNCNEWITLRKSPSTSAASLAHIPLGEPVGYIERAGNGFYKIKYNGMTGYGLAKYLSSSRPEETASETNYETIIGQVVNCNEWITLRKSPSTSAASLTHIPLGEYVTYISDAANDFYYVEYNGQYGYVLRTYIKF